MPGFLMSTVTSGCFFLLHKFTILIIISFSSHNNLLVIELLESNLQLVVGNQWRTNNSGRPCRIMKWVHLHVMDIR